MIQIDSTSTLTSVSSTSNVDVNGVVNLVLRANTVEGAGATCWPMVVRLTGVLGLTPKMRVSAPAPFYWGTNWNFQDRGYFSYDRLTWTQMANPVIFGAGYYEISHNAPFTQDEVWVARDRVEGVLATTTWINTLAAAHLTMIQPLNGANVWTVDTYSQQTDERGRVVPSQPLLGLMLDDPEFPGPKRTAAIISGIHAAEHWGRTTMRYFVNWLCGPSMEARLLRSMFRVVVLPYTNPIGGEGGHTRAQWQLGANGINDLNRNWDKNPAPFETVAKVREALLRLVPAGMPWFMDFHSSINTQGNPNLGWMGSTGEPTNAPLNNEFGARLNARMTGNGGAARGDTIYPNDQMWSDSWAAHQLGAQLAQTIECNSGNPTPLSVANASGIGIGLALYDLAAAGRFGVVVPPPVILPQIINSFTATPVSVNVGQTSALSWTTSNATAVTLNGLTVAANGNQSITPAAGATWTLRASGSAPDITRTLTWNPPPVVLTAQ